MATSPRITRIVPSAPYLRGIGYSTPRAGSVAVSGTSDPGASIRLVDALVGDASLGSEQGAYNAGTWTIDLSGGILSYVFRELTPGLHVLVAQAFPSGLGGPMGAVSSLVQIRVGTDAADTLVGLQSSDTTPGPWYVSGGGGEDTIVAYNLVPDPATGRRGPEGATVFIVGGRDDYHGFGQDIPDSARDTVVVPAPLSEIASHSYSFPGETHLVLSPRLAPRLDLAEVERLRFDDAQLTVQSDVLADFLYYDQRYPDLAAADVNARAHYGQYGWREGRDPDALFSTQGYLGAYGDVRAAGANPLDHYDANGWKEGRDPSALFDTALYLRYNPDVAAAGVDPLQHYLASGMSEGRRSLPAVGSSVVRDGFDPLYYALANPDVSYYGLDPFRHWQEHGRFEGRNPDGFFDAAYYLRQNPDVAAAGLDALDHYDRYGWREGRDPSTHFSTGQYLAAYADVRAARISPLQHFLQYGVGEGRSGFGDIV